MSTLSTDTDVDRLREQSRRADGKFGSWGAGESGAGLAVRPADEPAEEEDGTVDAMLVDEFDHDDLVDTLPNFAEDVPGAEVDTAPLGVSRHVGASASVAVGDRRTLFTALDGRTLATKQRYDRQSDDWVEDVSPHEPYDIDDALDELLTRAGSVRRD